MSHTDPQNGRFDRIVEPSIANSKFLPKMFIWCPIKHKEITIGCPIHGHPLKIGEWTDLLETPKAHPRNPRLIYDIGGNVVLVQADYHYIYSLPGHQKSGHSYLSASKDILDVLPESIANEFPMVMQIEVVLLYVYTIL